MQATDFNHSPARAQDSLQASSCEHDGPTALGKQPIAHEDGAVLEMLPIPVFGLDRFGLVATWNPAMVRLTGRTREEALGQSFSAGLGTLRFLQTPVAEGDDHLGKPAELVFRDAQGLEHRHRCLFRVKRDAEGSVLRLLGVVVPEPECSVPQAEVTRNSPQVEETVAAILHALNNVQTVVSGNLERMPQDPQVELGQDLLGSLQDARRAADQQVRLLKALRRVLHGTNLQRGTCEVASTVEAFAVSAKGVLPRGVELTTSLLGEHSVAVTPADLEDALLRLVWNSVEAAGSEVKIELACRPSMLLPDHVEVTVRDDGPGVHRDALPRLTDPHFTTKSVVGRTGLGLTLVDLFVRGSGGHLSVESRSGAGTLVRIQLPYTSSTP